MFQEKKFSELNANEQLSVENMIEEYASQIEEIIEHEDFKDLFIELHEDGVEDVYLFLEVLEKAFKKKL